MPGVGVLPAPAGDTAGLVGVRPGNIRLAAGDPDDCLHGTVLHVSCFGGSSRIAVTVPGPDRPVRPTVPGPATVASGARVALSWAPESAVLIETTGDTP
ncbi:hypothetical protein GCM10009654_23640 [Streptomyces hebeiensis]|uniref:Transport-associated OB type 2 domain-containing protein n=1 Tax=Streptomyces hebeiensis TaxID=229486 RepID=A0ABN1UVQ5_9ACTN